MFRALSLSGIASQVCTSSGALLKHPSSPFARRFPASSNIYERSPSEAYCERISRYCNNSALAWFVGILKDKGLRPVTYLCFARTPILLLKITVVEFILLIFEGQLDIIERLDLLQAFLVPAQPVLKILLSLVIYESTRCFLKVSLFSKHTNRLAPPRSLRFLYHL